MGILNKLFGGSSEVKEQKTLPWIPLVETKQLEDIKNNSDSKVQLVFKHSTRCGISRMVMNSFISSFELKEEEVDLYYLDLLNYRDVSNQISETFQVMHQSPQLLVIKNGEIVAHASHSSINEIDIKSFVA